MSRGEPTGRAARVAKLAGAAAAVGAVGAGVEVAAQLRLARPEQPPSERWRQLPVHARGATRLGISFRPRQAVAFELDPDRCLRELLDYPFQVLRLAAYWNEIEPAPGAFRPDGLDRQIEAAERAGKQLVVCLGPVKSFGYPEFFVPAHHLPRALPEGQLVTPEGHQQLLRAALTYLTRLVERYRGHESIVAWQVEHEALDPLGLEHSWRLSERFVRAEVAAVRAADPHRPVLMNGFLPTSTPVAASQRWRTRGQGDSLALAGQLADVVGVDFYPRHAVVGVADRAVYLDGSRGPAVALRLRRLAAGVAASGQDLMICEGQAEPWETATVPASPTGRVLYSCRPEDVIGTYNLCLRPRGRKLARPSAYLFWGAEYWLARRRDGDASYLRAFERVLTES